MQYKQKYIIFAPSNNYQKMDIKRKLAFVIHERMKTKSDLEMVRWLSEVKGSRYDSMINMLLDRLSALNRLEKELNDELKNKKS